MVLAKVLPTRADLPATLAAVLAFTQSAAAALGVLAVVRTPDGLLNVPDAELALVSVVTFVVAVILAAGCVHTLSGRSVRLSVVGSVGSLVISAYWILLRPPDEGFPGIAVAYAALPVLILALVGLSRVLGATRAKTDQPAPAEKAPAQPEDGPVHGQHAWPWESDENSTKEDTDPSDYEPAHEDSERPWESDEDESGHPPRRDMLVE